MKIRVIHGPYEGKMGILLGLDYKSTIERAGKGANIVTDQFRTSAKMTATVRILADGTELKLPIEDVEGLPELIENRELTLKSRKEDNDDCRHTPDY